MGCMTLTWAHRGASGTAPENTLPAFEQAIRAGADGIELDLQRTSDGHLVVCHDETVDRTSNGHGAIVDLTLDELRALDFAHGDPRFVGTRIPLLQEVFELMRPAGLLVNVELKDSEERYWGMDLQALALAEQMGMADRVLWSSFNHNSLCHLRESDAGAAIGVLFSEPLFEPWHYAQRIGAQAIHPYWRALEFMPQCVERCHGAGVAVNVWTVNTARDLEAMQGAGVDAVITNFPELASASAAATS